MTLLSDLVNRDRSGELMGRLQMLMSLLAPQSTGSSSSYSSVPSDTTGEPAGPGTFHAPEGGDTENPYRVWDLPFAGLQPDDPQLVTRHGVTLQRGPLRSLVDIARESDILPGLRELNQILQGYRSPEQQAYAAQTNPNAAEFGYSYHPEGLAADMGWWTDRLADELWAAGWNQLPSESWHWSYGVEG